MLGPGLFGIFGEAGHAISIVIFAFNFNKISDDQRLLLFVHYFVSLLFDTIALKLRSFHINRTGAPFTLLFVFISTVCTST